MDARQEVRLITISREFGAGGSELAIELGSKLGWPILDSDLAHRVAERLRVDHNIVETLDEHPPSLLKRIASVLLIPQPEWHSFPPLEEMPNADAIAAASRAVIEEMGASPPLIIVGHGAQCIFAGRHDVLNVRVVAPVDSRLARLINRLGVPSASALPMLRKADADRQTYVQRYFQRDVRDDLLYDLRINTGGLSIEESGALIVAVVQGRQKNFTATSASSA